jgi:hypothetical protein
MANIRESLTVRMGLDEQTRCKMPADSAWHPSRLATMRLKQRMPFLRSSVWRLGMGLPRFRKTGQFGDGREEACAAYVEANARRGDVDDVLATIDKFATEESMLVNVGDEKGELLDVAVRRANPGTALERRRRRCTASSSRRPMPKWPAGFGRTRVSTTALPA